jgi:hypothetical protein
MALTCNKCQRSNPADAAYCYHDGTVLNGHGQRGPVSAGRQLFAHPFVFPSGRSCRNFDELALACQEDWTAARSLLREGYFERFLGGIGRIDLAKIARDAARSTDPDHGLDELLEKIPNESILPPRLAVQPQEINLGTLTVGQDRSFQLRLQNLGMRLVRGTATCEDTPWLSLGEGAGARQKIFQFGSDTTMPVRIIGQCLRAGIKPLEARVILDSNGGAITITVRAEVPVKPFPTGVLQGATTPRQIAEKAKASPKEAAVFFENGAVPRWYQDNGWIYPVQGPAASGLGAVQQFFEALGLTPPPKVEVNTRSVALTGRVGERLEQMIQVKTQEKRPVFAHAVSDQPWLKVGKTDLQGRVANIPLIVSEVPDHPGQRLQAQVTVTANGNQRFPITVTLWVDANGRARPARSAVAVPAASAVAASPVMAVPAAVAVAEAVAAEPEVAVAVAPAEPWQDLDTEPQKAPRRRTAAAVPLPLPVPTGAGLLHLLPLAALMMALFVVFGIDVVARILAKPPSAEPPQPVVVEEKIHPNPLVELKFHNEESPVLLAAGGSVKSSGPQPDKVTPAIWEPSMRFGLSMVQGGKRLTFKPNGETNNTVILLDDVHPSKPDNELITLDPRMGSGLIFGETPWRHKEDAGKDGLNFHGQWKKGERETVIAKDVEKGKGGGFKSVWEYPKQKIVVTQFVEIIAGEQSRKLDTVLVRYVIENNDTREHKVGLRFMLDTFIGDNDGVPFTIPNPNASELCDTRKDFDTASKVPDYIEALENGNDLTKPGTIARVQFRLGQRVEAPSRVTLGAWPNTQLSDPKYGLGPDAVRCLQEKTLWEVPVFPIKAFDEQGDSCVVMYWPQKALPAGEKREVGFAYGLGNVSAGDKDSNGRLGLSVGGRFVPGGEFTLTALVANPKPKEELTLTLPEGFKLVSGELKQKVPPVPDGAARQTSPVTWKIKAGNVGNYPLKVQSSAGASQNQPVTIRGSSIFD